MTHSVEEMKEIVSQPVSYEAPRIETVLTPEALEREVHYAGNTVVSGVTN